MCFSIPLTKLLNDTKRRSTSSGSDKTERCFLQNKSSSLVSKSNSRPNDSPESARVTQMLTDRCFYLLSESTEQTEIGRRWSMSPALMCASAEYQPSVTVRIHRDTEFHEQPPLFPHRATTKPGVRACMSRLPESAARVQIGDSRKCVFPQLWVWMWSATGSPRCVQSVRYMSVSSTVSVINEGSSTTNAEPWWMTFTSSSSSSRLWLKATVSSFWVWLCFAIAVGMRSSFLPRSGTALESVVILHAKS